MAVMRDPLLLSAPAPPPGTRPGPLPRLSVLVPVYEGAHTVGEALESLLTQSPPPDEVVVSDDGSTDNIDRALAPFARHIRLVRGPNAGLATARNRAAAAAQGDLLALLDADDVWLPGRAAALTAAAAARPDLAVLTTDAVVVRDGRPDERTYYDVREFCTQDQELGILRSNFILGAGAVRADAFRRAGGYRDGARSAEDWDLWLRLLLSGHRAGLVREPLYEYRRRTRSLTGDKLALSLGVLAVLQHSRPLARDRRQRRQLQRTEQEWRERLARAARSAQDPRATRLALRAASGRRASTRARATLFLAAVPRRALRDGTR